MPSHLLYVLYLKMLIMENDYTLDQLRLAKALRDQDEIYERCSVDPIFYINNFVKTEDPRSKTGGLVSLKLYEYQEEYVLSMHDAFLHDKDILIDKSRDMGATWVTLAYLSWLALFYPRFQGLIGSKTADDVDKAGLPNTIFGKLDIVFNNIPKFLMPDMEISRTDKKLAFYKIKREKVNGEIVEDRDFYSSLTGQSCTENFSVSGRYSLIFLDEFSKWGAGIDTKAWGQTADTSRCRFIIGTPNGMGNEFANIRFGESIKRGVTVHIEFHWRQHPTKGVGAWYDEEQKRWRSPWYDSEVLRRQHSDGESLSLIRQELDIDYITSGSPTFPERYLNKWKPTFTEPQYWDRYSMGIDFASETGKDRQSIDILSKSNGEQIFHWDGNISMNNLFLKIRELYIRFNKCLVVPETNADGDMTLRLLRGKVNNLYRQIREDSVTRKKALQYGFNMTGRKEMIVMKTVNALELGDVKITEQCTIDEMRIYEDKGVGRLGGKYGAPDGKHDDRVTSFMLAVEGLDYVPKVDKNKYDQKVFDDFFGINKKKDEDYIYDCAAY